MKYFDLKAEIHIENGELCIGWMNNGCRKIIDSHDQLFILRDIVNEKMRNYENEFQKQFVPTKDTKYKLPENNE